MATSTIGCSSRRIRIAAAAVLAASSLSGMTASSAAHASPVLRRPQISRPHAVAGPPGLSLGLAMAKARATHGAVIVSSLTTANSTTIANPDGKFTTTESLAPVRAFRNGRWLPLNGTLHKGVSGRLVPAAATASMSLSDGGSGSLAVLSDTGRTMSLSWPGALPVPVVSGATATYADVPVQGADLIVTVSPLGEVSTVIRVNNAAAATSPALAALTMTVSAPGMNLSAASGGSLSVGSSGGAPAFTADPPQMWDSAPLPSGTPTVTDPSSGEILEDPTGLPADSTPGGPGAAATVTTIPVSVSGSAFTLTPPPSALAGPQTVYPVYIDPTWQEPTKTKNASAWTQIESGQPNDTSNWMQNGCLNGSSGPCLQVGFCDSTGPNMEDCGNLGITRTMFAMPLPSLNVNDITVDSADIFLENVWTAACSAQKIQFWTAPAISSGTNWTNSSVWNSNVEDESFDGYGEGPPCGPGYSPSDVVFGTSSGTKPGVTITGGGSGALAGIIQSDLHKAVPSTKQTFGLRASSEDTTPCDWNYSTSACGGTGTAFLQWRQFMNTSQSMKLQFTWVDPPKAPDAMSTSPGGACHTSDTNEAQIGNDDVTLSAFTNDPDGDPDLTTAFRVYSVATGQQMGQDLTTQGTGRVQAQPLTRATIQGWQPDGDTTAYRYYYTAQSTNQTGQPPGPVSVRCYFFYNPNGPSAPTVHVNGGPFPATVHLGEVLQPVTFAPTLKMGQTCPAQPACPLSYSYQIGARAPVTVSQAQPQGGTWGANDTWTGSITIPVLGPLAFAVTETDSTGNPGEPFTAETDSLLSGGSLPDGYFSDGEYPDLLFTGNGSEPSLWLAKGTGNGTVGSPRDIGSLGNGLFGNTASDGPADWTGAMILHGDLTGDHEQDIMSYWPKATQVGTSQTSAGTGLVLAGYGAAIADDPGGAFWPSGSTFNVNAQFYCDQQLDMACADEPLDLIVAGNASQTAGSQADLIGIYGDSTHGYELNLYSTNEPGDYAYATTLSAPGQAPGATKDWSKYVLATTMPGNNPAATVLFAIDKATGGVYESVNQNAANPSLGQDCTTDPNQDICSIIGSSASTWSQIQTPAQWPAGTSWTSGSASLLSADINNGTGAPGGQGTGNIELWTRTGANNNTATAYQLVGSSLEEETPSSVAAPSNDWPLTDGTTDLSSNGPQTPGFATDTVTGSQTAPLGGTFKWQQDARFNTVLDFTATTSNGYMAPPAATLSTSPAMPLSLSLWFSTTVHDGVIASIQKQAVSAGSTLTSGYDPVMYVGNNGILFAEWWNGTAQPINSGIIVDDGLWHHAVLTVTAGTQTLTVDGTQVASTLTGGIDLADVAATTHLTFGAGYIGGNWPHEANFNSSAAVDFLNGQIADINLTQ